MPPNFVVGRCWRPLRASRREDWQIEHPGRGRDAPACHCHPTRAGGQGPARRREQGGQVRQAGANRRWPPPGLGPALHGAAWAVDGVGCVLQSRAQRRPPWGGEPRLPSRFLGVQPAPHALARGRANGRRDVGCHAASARAQRPHAPAGALAPPMPQGMAQAHAHACCGTQRPPTLGRTLQAIGEGPPDPGRRRRRQGCAGTRALGCGTGAGPRGRAGAPRPAPPAAADGGPSPRLRPASAVRGIGQARDRARQGTPRHNGHQARRPQGPDSAREGQGREEGRGAPPGADCAHHGGPTGERGPRPAAACGSARQQAAGPCRPLGRWGLGGASGCARPGAPARQARGASGPPRAAAGRVAERKAEGEEAGEDARDKRVGGAQESHGGRRIVASDGERTVAACQCGSLSPGAPAGQLAVGAAESS